MELFDIRSIGDVKYYRYSSKRRSKDRGRFSDSLGINLQRFPDLRDLPFGFPPISPFDRLADRRNGFHGVARVESRRVGLWLQELRH